MKRSAEIVRMEPLPRVPTAIITGTTRTEVETRAARGIRRKEFGAVSEIVNFKGGYAAKATLLPRKEPLPMWARVLVRIAWSLAGLFLALSLVIAGLSALLGSLVNLPWLTIAGGAVVVALLLLGFTPTRQAVTVIVKVLVR